MTLGGGTVSSALFAGAITRVRHRGVELLPEIHQGEFTARVALGIGSPLEHTDTVLSGIDERIRAIDGVAITALTVVTV